MKEISNYNDKLNNSEEEVIDVLGQLSNPLSNKTSSALGIINNYSQTVKRGGYDYDIAEVIEVVRILNNMAPLRMPVYNFNIDMINGDHYYKPDKTLLLVREYDGDLIRDYYYNPEAKDSNYTVDRILEHDKNTGRLRAKITPIIKTGSHLNTNITIFDEKINNKYIIIQLADEGIVNNISEFSGNGKSFQTLFRNLRTLKPARYLEGKDQKETGFEMIDCIFDSNGSIARIKRYNNKKEINIDYSNNQKIITVKSK